MAPDYQTDAADNKTHCFGFGFVFCFLAVYFLYKQDACFLCHSASHVMYFYYYTLSSLPTPTVSPRAASPSVTGLLSFCKVSLSEEEVDTKVANPSHLPPISNCLSRCRAGRESEKPSVRRVSPNLYDWTHGVGV